MINLSPSSWLVSVPPSRNTLAHTYTHTLSLFPPRGCGIMTATYGLTPTARRDRLDFIGKQLKAVQRIEHRVREGMVVQADEIALLRSKKNIIAQRDLFASLPTGIVSLTLLLQSSRLNVHHWYVYIYLFIHPSIHPSIHQSIHLFVSTLVLFMRACWFGYMQCAVFVDVSVKLQQLADKGGVEFILDCQHFDPNFVFGNPSPGVPKILEVNNCKVQGSVKRSSIQQPHARGIY